MSDRDSAPTPPRLARWLLKRLLDNEAYSAIAGDLDEEFVRFIHPALGARRARRWYWRQAIGSLTASLARPSPSRRPTDPERRVGLAIVQDRHGLASDLRSAVRFVVRNPLLSMTAIVTLALGVGATSAVFSVVNALMFKRLPVVHADRVVAIESKDKGAFSYPEYLEARNAAGLDALTASGSIQMTLSADGVRELAMVQLVAGNFFDTLGVLAPRLGRLLTPADDDPAATTAIVLSDALWRDRFGADLRILGRSIRLRNTLCIVVGVAPASFFGIDVGYRPDLWLPLTQGPRVFGDTQMLGRRAAWLQLIGRLQRRDTLETTRASLTALWRHADGRDEAVVTRIPRGRSWMATEHRTRLAVVGALAGLVLIVGCLNVSTLLAARTHARQRELAVRATLGAGRLRLFRQLLMEHLLLAAIGGALGAVVGVFVARGLVSLMSTRYTPPVLDVGLDLHVALFVSVLALATGLAFGLVPALGASRWGGVVAWSGGAPSGAGRTANRREPWWLIPWQVAIGTVLLATAGLFVQTVRELELGVAHVDPSRVLLADLHIPESRGLPSDQAGPVLARLRTFAGVEAAAASTLRPLASISRGPVDVQNGGPLPVSRPMAWGPPPPPPPKGTTVERRWIVSNSFVSPEFFRAIGMPLMRGRTFTDRDQSAAPRVAVANETFARRAFGKSNPLGRRISHGVERRFDIEIVGVVGDLRYEHLREAAPDGLFFPLAQLPAASASNPTVTGRAQPIDVTLTLRLRTPGAVSAEHLRREVRSVDPQILVSHAWTLEDETAQALVQERLLAWLASAFGVLALFLVLLGLYAAMAGMVGRRTRELGVRLALGARPGSLRLMVLRQSLLVVSLGLALGVPLVHVATRSFVHLLYGVQPFDARVLLAVIVLLLATAALATLGPARRAGRVDPVVALRAD